MKTAFVTDSGCGLSVEEAKKYGIYSVPLQVMYDNESKQDLEEIDDQKIWDLLKQEKVIKTSLPSAGAIDELFEQLKNEGYTQVFCISITRGISSTADTFALIANQHQLSFVFVDCYSTAYIQQHCIIHAKKMYDAGYSIEQITEICKKSILNSDTFVIPASCDQLIRSGRLTGFAATLAGLLKIKPWLHLNFETNGKIDALGKTRSQEKLVSKTIEQLKEKVKENYNIHITHVDALAYANQIKQEITTLFKNVDVFVSSLIAPVSVHTGLGCIAIQYYPKIEMRNFNDTNQ